MEGFKAERKIKRCDQLSLKDNNNNKKKKKNQKKKFKIYDCRDELLERFPLEGDAKIAALKATHSIVSIVVTGGNPESHTDDYENSGTGTIVECENIDDVTYSATILTPATIFEPTNGRRPEVDVYLSDGRLCKGEVIDCDFHYNLVAVRIHADSPFKAAKLRSLNDTLSDQTQRGQLNPHSDKFRCPPGTKVLVLARSYGPQCSLEIESAVFCTNVFSTRYDCKELCWLKDCKCSNVNDGAAVINYSGEVIGILLSDSSFLPTNIVSRWWSHYKSYRKFCRPWHGVEVSNLHASNLEFLELFTSKFPSVTEGAVVTKVVRDSPAYRSGIRLRDVIVKCDAKLVRSNLEFYEKIWDNAGKCVELELLRESNGQNLSLNLTIGETAPVKFYQWPIPDCY